MLFAFRGVRVFQVIAAIIALAAAVGAVLSLKAFTAGGSPLLLPAAVVLGLVFIWAFATALRAPTSFVAVAPERTRIRFAGFVDTVVDNRDIVGVRLARQSFWGGLGVRSLSGRGIALLTAWGEVAEMELRSPIRVWLVPNLIPLRGTRVRVSIKNPQKLVERFGSAAAASSPEPAPARKMRRRGP